MLAHAVLRRHCFFLVSVVDELWIHGVWQEDVRQRLHRSCQVRVARSADRLRFRVQGFNMQVRGSSYSKCTVSSVSSVLARQGQDDQTSNSHWKHTPSPEV